MPIRPLARWSPTRSPRRLCSRTRPGLSQRVGLHPTRRPVNCRRSGAHRRERRRARAPPSRRRRPGRVGARGASERAERARTQLTNAIGPRQSRTRAVAEFAETRRVRRGRTRARESPRRSGCPRRPNPWSAPALPLDLARCVERSGWSRKCRHWPSAMSRMSSVRGRAAQTVAGAGRAWVAWSSVASSSTARLEGVAVAGSAAAGAASAERATRKSRAGPARQTPG